MFGWWSLDVGGCWLLTDRLSMFLVGLWGLVVSGCLLRGGGWKLVVDCWMVVVGC